MCQLQQMFQRQRKVKPVFKDIPHWLGAYKGHNISTNNSQFHYYSVREDLSQPVTLRISDESSIQPMTMYYNIQPFEEQPAQEKDESPLKDLSELIQAENKYKEQIELSKDDIINDSSWVRKYQPKRFIDLLTDQYINRNVLTWMKSWDEIVFKKKAPKAVEQTTVQGFFRRGQTQNKNWFMTQDYNYKKLILLAGPPGCGKTTLARVVAKHCGYHYEQINASDDRSGKNLIHKIHNLVTHQTVGRQQKPICVIIDEVDGALDSDANGIKQVLNYIETGVVPGEIKKEKTEKKGKKDDKNKLIRPEQLEKEQQNERKTKIDRPVIFICNDPFVRGLKDLRGRAIVVHFGQLHEDRVVKRLKQIYTRESSGYIQNEILVKICQLCNNDVRSSVGVLELAYKFQKNHNTPPKDTIDKLNISISKDVVASSNEFIQKLNSSKNQEQGKFSKYEHYLEQHNNPSLLFNTFFHNLHHYKNVYYRFEPANRLYRQIIEYDVKVNQHHGQIDQFACMPYFFFKITFKPQDFKKIEFPSIFFEKAAKQRNSKALLEKIFKQIPPNIKIFTPPAILVKELFHLFWLTMQTASPKEQDVLRCVYNMLTYGFKLAPRNSPHLFTPEFDQFLAFGNRKPEIILSSTTRNLMEENYEFLKMKSQLIQESFIDGRQDYQTVINQLKRNRRRNRQLHEGTGTEIKYDMKIGHFFKRSVL